MTYIPIPKVSEVLQHYQDQIDQLQEETARLTRLKERLEEILAQGKEDEPKYLSLAFTTRMVWNLPAPDRM